MTSHNVAAEGEAQDISPPPPPLWLGYAAVAAAVVIWAGWIVTTRVQVGALIPNDVALMRFGVPALVLAPIWLRGGLIPKGQPLIPLLIMAAGWGGPFVLLTSHGLKSVPASFFGPMVPATLPLLVALWDRFVERTPLAGPRLLGLGLILASICLVLGPALGRADAGVLEGAPYLLAAACGWCAFTLAYRRTTMSGLQATAYVSLYSVPFLLALSFVQGSRLDQTPVWDLAFFLVVQGLLSGVVSVAAFAYAVRTLGVARTSSWTSLVPMGAAVGGWALLGEQPGPLGWTAVCAACLGVAAVNGVFNGLFERRPRR